MHEAQFLASVRTFDQSDAINTIGQTLIKDFHQRGVALTVAQCTIIDTTTNTPRMWIFCDDLATPIEEMITAMQRPKSAATYALAELSQRIIVETDGNTKAAHLFLFILLYHLGHLTFAETMQKLHEHHIVR